MTAGRVSPTAALPATIEPSHPCRTCGAAIADRYRFPDCTRCALAALAADPDLVAWRAERRAAAYARLAAAGLVRGRS